MSDDLLWYIPILPFSVYGAAVLLYLVFRVIVDIYDAWSWHHDQQVGRRTTRPRLASDPQERSPSDETIPDHAWS